MSAPDGFPESADDLLRCLGAFARSVERWVVDLDLACPARGPGDPAFAPVFRRWLEHLAEIRLHLHRCEHRLLHLTLAGPGEEAEPLPTGPGIDRRARLEHWLDHLHLPTTYLRVTRVLDLEDEALPADIVTDLAVLAALADRTLPRLARLAHERPFARLQDAAYFGILAPWRHRGLPALDAATRWLGESLDDSDAW
jgi:hypothetical protein